MLPLPNEGIHRSVTSHNINRDVFCDYIEASALFEDEEGLSQSEVVDFLVEQEIYDSEDFCNELIANVWKNLFKRLSRLGTGSPLSFVHSRIIKRYDWQDIPAHSLCLILSLKPFYSGWQQRFAHDHNEQGELFERLVAEALPRIFPRWESIVTGWSANHAIRIQKLVPELSRTLRESHDDLTDYKRSRANEFGLDVVSYLNFGDGKGGNPVYLVQCASGHNWQSKLKQPDMAIWKNLIKFNSPPMKMVALPFELSRSDFIIRSKQSEGILLDRYRILSPCAIDRNWISNDLREGINNWLSSRVEWLLHPDSTRTA